MGVVSRSQVYHLWRVDLEYFAPEIETREPMKHTVLDLDV